MKTKRWLIIGLLVLILIVIVAAIVISGQLVSSDDPVERTDAFPLLSGVNLLLERVTVPDDLTGEYRLVVVAYDSDQQIFVDKWLLPLEELNEDYPQLAGYYLPLLPQDTSDAALPIIGGMTIAAESDKDRERTIVVFTDVEAFNELVGVPDTSQVQLFLLDTAGKILWHGSGRYSHETYTSLETTLEELSRGDS